MEQIPAQRRPHCPPVERLAILALRAARAYPLSQAARHLQVSTATIASWTDRLDEQGSCSLEAKKWTSDGVGGKPDGKSCNSLSCCPLPHAIQSSE